MEQVDKLINFYENEGAEELRLLPGGIQRIEYDTATMVLERYLPEGGRVLDSCAGTGIYSNWLAEKGYRVVAGDIVPKNVLALRDVKSRQPLVEEVYQGDATNLSQFEDESFDVVLCMGALYHISNARERARAVGEGIRLLKKGGVFVGTYMNRYAVMMNNLMGDLANIDEVLQFTKTGESGVFYSSTPEQMEALCSAAGLEKRSHVTLDGQAIFLFETTHRIDISAYNRWKEIHNALCEQPSLLGSGYHNMFIGIRT